MDQKGDRAFVFDQNKQVGSVGMIEKLKEDLAFWQKTLRLQDWDVQLIWSKNQTSAGRSRKLSDYKAAEISIQDPECHSPTALGNADTEVTLVHELLHLQGERLDDFINSDEGRKFEVDNERMIELTAIALVELRRQIKA